MDGSRGAFTVIADKEEIWNKQRRGDFPSEAFITEALAAMFADAP